jgi:hypothetical protein
MLPRLRRGLVVVAFALGTSLLGGLVFAQDGGSTAASPSDAGPTGPTTAPATAPATAPTPTPAITPDAGPKAPTPQVGAIDTSPTKKRASISPNDMVEQANVYMTKMKDALKRVIHLQELTRRQKDVIKLNCVNDKLLQVKQLLNIAESANTDLSEAIARNDEEGRYHQFGRITIAHQQVTTLAGEAENCVGEDISFLGPTEVTVDKPDEPDDPTIEPVPQFPFVDPPPVASPYI